MAVADNRAPLLEAVDLVAGYVEGVDILNGCSFALYRGEIVGVIGPNGAGKSTLVKVMFGLLPPRRGRVLFESEPIAGLAPHVLVGRGIGYVPQSNNVFPSLTIRENLEMGIYRDPSRWDERFERVVTLFPLLRSRLGDRAGVLSGGERQMVGMARALMMEPKLLLLDEPSAGLAPAVQDEVFARIDEINATGVSIAMVEQNARRCLQICDRGYVLDEGRNAYTGQGADLLNDPKIVELYLGTMARVR